MENATGYLDKIAELAPHTGVLFAASPVDFALFANTGYDGEWIFMVCADGDGAARFIPGHDVERALAVLSDPKCAGWMDDVQYVVPVTEEEIRAQHSSHISEWLQNKMGELYGVEMKMIRSSRGPGGLEEGGL